MRFIFHNPHESNMYKTPLDFYKRRKKSVEKYSHLIDFFLQKDGIIYSYVDSYNHKPRVGIKKILPRLFGFYIWALVNKINPLRIKLITKASDIKNSDVLVTFLYLNFTCQNGNLSDHRLLLNNDFSKIAAFKVVHFSHFNYNSKYASQNLRLVNFDLIIAENNLLENSQYFQHYFNWFNKDFLVVPFVPKERFRIITPFFKRKNKAVATGTITLPMDQDFINFFGHSDLHPMRTLIFEQKEKLYNYIDSFISPIIEKDKNKQSDSQKKYFSFDIVQKYNEYMMFIVPEEISGLPGIGFVEGMKCGTAFIGKECKMYSDLGLINGINYIGYDGTIEDLINKIIYYQNSAEELEKIALCGFNLMQKEFTKEKIGYKILNKVTEIQEDKLQKIY
jgi:hypothetical protein